ncbi:MAG: malonyl-ACP O-methyltransferase BioC [Halioglobus sp.]
MTEIQLASEFLPACGEARQDLVLLHGWAGSPEVWRPMLPPLRQWANVTLVDLTAYGSGLTEASVAPVDSLMAAILAAVPERAIFVGWSLGGQIAACLAHSYPHRVNALITLCSNPRFVADGEWPGMPELQFIAFKDGLQADTAATLRRFDSLQSGGSPRQRGVLRDLANCRRDSHCGQLLPGLELLEKLDLRDTLSALRQPQLHVFAGADALVPAAVPAALTSLLADVPAARIHTMQGSSHAMPLDAAIETASVIFDLVASSGLNRDGCDLAAEPAKAEVAESFSRAAGQYDSAAQLQRAVGTRLLESTDYTAAAPELVLDLGCGTGYFHPALKRRFPSAHYVGLDLAPGMVQFARAQFPDEQKWLVADAEGLPLAANSVDLVFSSLAIQWCHSPQRLFAELARVLKPGGRCVFTSLGPETLKELRAAWAAVDKHQHVNTFLPPEQLTEAASAVPGVSLQLRSERFIMEYDRVRELLTELKTLGAHNMNRGRQTGLTGRRALQGMLTAYESWRKNDKLPATYDVLFGLLEKE